MTREDFGESTSLEVIDQLMSVSGLDLVDVGCGAGRLTRALAERGARMLGVEPDAAQAAKNREAEPVPGVTFAEAGGEALPAADASADGVFFSYSLHHVPAAKIDAALAEAMRVLRPGAGFLYVVEPVMAGSYAELSRPFNDESAARDLAYAALGRIAAPNFAVASEIFYALAVTYPDFDGFLAEKLAQTYNDHRRERIDTPEVRARFEAGRRGEGYVFEQRVRVNYYRNYLAGTTWPELPGSRSPILSDDIEKTS